MVLEMILCSMGVSSSMLAEYPSCWRPSPCGRRRTDASGRPPATGRTGLARVALTAGTAAQLVVDTAALVALGADDVQAAGGPNPLALLGAGLLGLWPAASATHPGVPNLLVVGIAVADGLTITPRKSLRSWAPSALPPSMMSVPRPAMLVAMVTAPFLPAWATISASCSWNLALRTLCLMPRLLSRRTGVSTLDGDGAHQDRLALGMALLDLRLTTASNLPRRRSCRPASALSLRATGRLVRNDQDRAARRSRGTRASSVWRYRSCRRASRTDGSSSGR